MLADVNLSPLVTVDKSLTGNAKYSSFFFLITKKDDLQTRIIFAWTL